MTGSRSGAMMTRMARFVRSVALSTVGLCVALVAACGGGNGGTSNTPVKANAVGTGTVNDNSTNPTDTGNAKSGGSNSPTMSGGAEQVNNTGSGQQFNSSGGQQNNNTGSGTQNNTTVVAAQPDRCAGFPIRSDGAYRGCLDECNRNRDNGLAKTGEKGAGAAGVRNAHKDCTDGCNGGKHDAESANCWGK